MIVSKSQVIARLDELQEYSVAEDAKRATPSEAAIRGFFTPVYAAVNTYFAAGGNVSGVLREIAQFMCFDIMRRTTKYEREFSMGLRSDFPAGYYDISECFYQFSQLLSVSNAEFYAAFSYGVPVDPAGGGGTAVVPLSNSYLTAWATELPLQPEADLARLNALNDWCQDAGDSDLVALFENQGKIIEHLELQEIARIIYVDRKLKAVIAARGLSVYVPSYLK